ncbi:MAG TPA: hypothetical protein VFQ91_08265 [Bryobacteraceae bacterium]|nr:hypothetical protein [Bryobacteraceae bacterium]
MSSAINPLESKSRDPIIVAVEELNAGYKNTDFSKRPIGRMGKGELFIVVFKGQNGEWFENYAWQAGANVFAAQTLQGLLSKAHDSLFPSLRDPEFVRLVMAYTLAVIFSIATISVAVTWAANPALQGLFGTTGLLIGYLIGNRNAT